VTVVGVFVRFRCAASPEAENILWDLTTSDDINYTLNTSENWLKSEDFIASEFEGIVEEAERSVIKSTFLI
jgi:hypothetical protein